MNLLQRNELQEWDFDAEGQDQEELQQRFEITGLDSLSWAFRKLAAFKAKEAEITALVEKEKARLVFWEQEQKKSLSDDIQFFEGLIKQYHAQQLAADPKAKTISTPYGVSKSRASKATVDKVDEAALLQYAQENNMRDCIKESLKWADLKKQLSVVDTADGQIVVDEATGEIVPGAVVKPASISYSIEAK